MKRIKVILLLLVCLVGLVSAQEVYDLTLDYGDLLPLPSLAETGQFNIHWNDGEGQLSITHDSDASKVLWASLPGTGFVGGAIAVADIEEERGFFTIDDHKESVLNRQELLTWDDSGDGLVLGGTLSNDSMSYDYSLTIQSVSDDQLSITLEVDEPVNRTYLNYQMNDEAAIFGFGAQCSYFNHRGNRVPVLVQEQGIGRGDIDDPLIDQAIGPAVGNDYTSYISVPQYTTSDLNTLFLENYEISNFDFTGEDQAQIEVYSNQLSARVLYGETHADLIGEYSAYAGRMRVLPDWAVSGAIIGLQGGTQKLYDVWEQLKSEDTPLSAFWIQDWVGQRTTVVGKQLWWNWELEESRYPGYDAMLDSLKDANVALMGYINPFMVNVFREKEYRRNQYVEAHGNGYFVKREDGFVYQVEQTSFNSAILDLSNPETEIWIKDIIIDELIARGFRGWMADFGEALPFNVVLENADPATYHNAFAEEWARINREAIEEAGLGDDIVFFSRSGYSKSPGQSTLFWMGDQMVNWEENDGIKSAVTGLLSGGMSGFSLNHSDIGGYASINFEPFVPLLARSEELLRRWTEMNAFTTVFRTHEGLGPELNWQFYNDEASLQHFAKWAKVYSALFFYRKQLVEEASLTGMPVVRHPVMHFPDDENVYDLSYQQFMLGDQFMIAPVLNEGESTTDIYLPAGEWVNLWSGDNVSSSGQTFTITGIEDRPAVFYLSGSSVASEFIQNMMNLGVYE
ncbi:MAG: alpha-glucosidase [Bacteroidetes bacterium]|nr:alpha-glucosidase [Bacteroidota bacterium]